MSTLPATADLLIRVIGEGAAILLMRAYGGQTVEFPKGEIGRGEKAYAALAEVIGMEATALLTRHFGGSRAYIPRCEKQRLAKRNRGIVTAYNEGATIGQLVRENQLSDRQVRNILKDTDMNDVGNSLQQSLF